MSWRREAASSLSSDLAGRGGPWSARAELGSRSEGWPRSWTLSAETIRLLGYRMSIGRRVLVPQIVPTSS
jgi:hypothetical protein